MSVPLYAASGFPEVWLTDLNSDTIEVYPEPGPGAYEKSARFARGDQVLSAILPGLAIDANVALSSAEKVLVRDQSASDHLPRSTPGRSSLRCMT
jgi:Putative restriction endonuclease